MLVLCPACADLALQRYWQVIYVTQLKDAIFRTVSQICEKGKLTLFKLRKKNP